MYKVSLMDDNCSPIFDGIAVFFTENIIRFEKNWVATGRVDNEQLKRFRQSKEGKIVTDYYSNNPSLNIVQWDTTNILFEKTVSLENIDFLATNAYSFQEQYHANTLNIHFIWLNFKNEYWRSASFKAIGVAEFSSTIQEYIDVRCFGNPVLINNAKYKPEPFRLCHRGTSVSNKIRKVPKLEDFKENTLESFCYTSSF